MDIWFWVLIGVFLCMVLIIILVAALMKIVSEESRKEENSQKQLDEHVFLIVSQDIAYAEFDLTIMFGSNIANKIETMERNKKGSSLEWLQSNDFFTELKKDECKIQRRMGMYKDGYSNDN